MYVYGACTDGSKRKLTAPFTVPLMPPSHIGTLGERCGRALAIVQLLNLIDITIALECHVVDFIYDQGEEVKESDVQL